MLNGPLAGKIIAFAVPIALASIFQQLLNTTDSIFAGRFIDAVALAAVGGLAPIINLFVGFATGLGIGANVTVAQHIGRGETEKIRGTIQTTTIVALFTSFILCGAGYWATDWILEMMAVPENAWQEATQYFHIYIIGLIFLIYYNFGAALLRAKGDTKRPLYALAAAAVVNVAFDYVGVGIMPGGVQEIAWATVISDIVAAAMVIFYLTHEDDTFRLTFENFKISTADLKSILYIGLPSGLQGALFSISNIVVQSGINSFGSNAIAGSSAAQNFEFYSWYFVNAFGQAAVTFVGQNFAAGKKDRCRKIIKFCFWTSLGTTVVLCCGIFTLSHEFILSLFTTESAALAFGVFRFWNVGLIEWLTNTYEIPAAAMRGMGWSISPTLIILMGSCVLRILFVMFLFPTSMNSYAYLMWLYPFTWVCMGIAMLILFAYVYRKELK